MTAQLQRDGFHVNHKRVLRILQESEWLCKPLKRFVRTTDSHHRWSVYPNLYRNQPPAQLNHIWVAESFFKTLKVEEGYLTRLPDRIRVTGPTSTFC